MRTKSVQELDRRITEQKLLCAINKALLEHYTDMKTPDKKNEDRLNAHSCCKQKGVRTDQDVDPRNTPPKGA
jgi:hypothetical protein